MQKIKLIFGFLIACAILLTVQVIPVGTSITSAQNRAALQSGDPNITAKLSLSVGRAELREWNQMLQDELTHPPRKLEEPAPFRPTIDMETYLAVKAAAASAKQTLKEPVGTLAPPKPIINFAGVDQKVALGRPPDTHIAVGLNDVVQVTNSHLDIFSKAGSLEKSMALDRFFGYFLNDLLDPRVVYDSTLNRWIITAVTRHESNTVQKFFMAISTTANPIGNYFEYKADLTFSDSSVFDFPQLGMDQGAIIITANIFPPEAGGSAAISTATAAMFAVGKDRLYNGLDFSVPVFTNLDATLAPPIVLDQNAKSFLIAAPIMGTQFKLYTLMNSSGGVGATLSGPVNITVPTYAMPPDAQQPAPCNGTMNTLDTSDGRFINASTQNGNSLWQVHTIADGSFATPKFYEIDTATNTVIQSGFFFASGSSHDFNASIVANSLNDVFVTWSSTDPGAGVNAQVRVSGRRSADPIGVISAGIPAFTSSACMKGNPTAASGGQRWGDYSAVTIDPSDILQAWIVNESIKSSNTWGSRILKVRF
jgi:hypothetical protein